MESSKKQPEQELVFHHTYLKALLDNKNNTSHWIAYKEKYEEVIKNLKFYNEKSKHAVCIPVGKKAFVKGQLVHTNDVWVTLGCGYFLKTSTKAAVEICERRIKVANELLEKWEKESKLLESMREYSINKDIFGGDEGKEIIEQFDEAAEEKWREEHREKEKEYKKKLKDIKTKTGSATLTDENDMWEHLEALELQEELEDELNRLGCNDLSSEDYESDSDNSSEENCEMEIRESNGKMEQDIQVESKNEIKPKGKRVTFMEISEKNELEESSTTKEEDITREAPDAVLDEVIENVPHVNNSKTDSEQKRPISNFKLNRKK